MARPSKFKLEYCEQLIEHMESGYSFETFAAVIDVDEATLHRWKTPKLKNGAKNPQYHDKFCKSYKTGKIKSQLFWETLGMRGIAGIPFQFTDEKGVKRTSQGFNAATYIFNMKNRFKWTDRLDHTTKDKPLPKGGFMVYRPEKLPDDYDEKMKQPGAANAAASTAGAAKPASPPAT